MSIESPDISVLIVGAGPAGLILALTLRQNGIPVRIIDREPRSRVGQRGAGIMPRSMELYNSLGVLPDIQTQAIPLVPMRIYKMPGGVEPVTTFPLAPYVPPTPSTPYTNILMLGQDHSEEIFRSHIAKYACHVELDAELHTFEQHGDHVKVTVVKQGREETITCRWLVGADGARGVVRKRLGLTFDGEVRDTSQHLVVGDVQIIGLDRQHWHSWGDMDSVLVMLRATEDDDTYFIFIGGRVDHAKIAQDRDELIRVLREGTGRSDIELGKVRWLSEYKPQIRMAEKFGQERVFVVGDAAHIHSPFGGQGLNSSVQDSVNLGWKLSLVEKGVALPSLLSTYTEERLPVIAEVLKTSNRLFDEAVGSKSDGSTSEKAWHRGGPLSQLGVNYRWSSITIDDRFPREERPLDPYGIDRAPGPLRAGERAPDAPGLIKVSADPLPLKNTGQVGMNLSLFDIFRPSYHTVLIFDDNIERLEGTLRILRSYPSALVRSVIVLPHGPSVALPTERGDLTVMDGDGHAYQGYAVDAGTFTTVIVRPDGAVGGVITQPEGMKRYFTGIFSAITA